MWGQQPAPAKPAEKADPPATYVGSDVCKGCHKGVFEAWPGNVHAKALAAEGLSDNLRGCEACHGPASAHIADPAAVKPIDPQALSGKEISDICGKCHFEDSANAVDGKTIQARFWRRSEHRRGDVSCLACHGGHASAGKLLKKESPDICLGCHKDMGKNGTYTHTPVAGGACTMCHDPHGSSQRHHLVSDISKACVTCHDVKGTGFPKAHSGYDVSASKCTACHGAHSKDKAGKLIKAQRHMPFKSGQCQLCHEADSLELAKPEKELCTMCHSKELAAAATDGTHVHPPVAEGLCSRCHSPHASDAPKALPRDKTMAYTCFLCHNKLEAGIDSSYPHKPARDLNCTGCHTPHTSKQENLLVKDSIELCKSCHEPHLHPLGRLADGQVVIDPTTKNMLTCASCHMPHGSDFDKLTKKDKNAALCVMCHELG